jgi:Copper binding periplasmic protein CusF
MERDNGYQPARRKPMSIMRTVGATVLAAALLINVTAAQDASISGEVKKIDAGSGKITLKHGPAKSLGMDEPMTMVYPRQGPRPAQAGEGRRQGQVRSRGGRPGLHRHETAKIQVRAERTAKTAAKPSRS